MYPPHQHHPKRRKKRPIHGVKTVDVTRGKSGYGFTISGQHPCVLSCIVNNSPADRVGLRPGDYLMCVNGQDVSKFGHDEVVRMVGMSTGTLTIQVAENYNSSDSSDDEYHPRTKSKYPSRVKRSQRYSEKMEKLLSDISQRERYCPDGHDPNSRPLPKTDVPKSRASRPRLHTPVGAENHELVSEGRSLIEAGGGVFKVPFQKSASASNMPAASRLPMQRVEPKQAFIKSTSHGQFRNLPHSSQPSRMVDNHMYSNFSPTSLQQIINHSLNSYSAANEAFILNEDDFDDADEEDQLGYNGGIIKIIVGYIGSLEMPGDANQPHVRIQSIRNAVRRLRVEQKIHTLVLMTVSDVGVKLTNMYGVDIALYPVKRLAFSGVCPDDRRFFGIVTLNKTDGDGDDSSAEDSPRNSGSSSCHVFMVDPEISAHGSHAQKARSFGLTCTVDQQTQRCLEFPRSTTPVILSISNLYKDRPGGTVSNDVARSQVFASPNQPAVERRSSTSSNNSNSDSGLGLGRDDNSTERIAAADIPPPPLPQRQPQLPQIKWSGNTIHLTQGPVKQFTPKATPDTTPHHWSSKSSLKSPQTSSGVDFDRTVSNEEHMKMGDKLNIRAMPNPASVQTGSYGQLTVDSFDQQSDAEHMRQSMQKLLQARQKQIGHDQTSSDTESRSSKSDGHLSTNLSERPVSAPFKYLSGESSSDLKTNTHDLTKNKTEGNPYSSDSSLADKLSPRAFLSSAFTPVGSVGSAFKKIRSRPQLHQLRSPSAPPVPSYHGDDEASDEDDMDGLIERFEKDKSFGLSAGDTDFRRYSEGHTLVRKRDQERKGVTPSTTPEIKTAGSTEKWIKAKQESLRRKAVRKNPLSLSHESLVVFDQEPVQQKLSSANSVNSIVSHVAKTVEEEESGRVAGWAVNFEKLLQDSVGIKIFTEFLKKEFSEENVEFWKVCEDYKNIVDSNFRKSKAKEIFDQYVSVRGSNSVNIDGNARKQVEVQLENPTPQTFDVAQAQIFQLMKQDSFARFLKSDLYKENLMKEMEGKPLEGGVTVETSGEKVKNDKGEKENKKKGKGKENEEYKEKRRRSLLPWRQNFIGNKKNSSKSSSETDTKTSKSKLKEEKEKEKETDVNSNVPFHIPVQSTDVPVITARNPSVPRVELPDTIDEEPEQPRFCRVIMPDGSTTVVGAKQGQTINYVLGKMLDKRGLSIASVDVFLLGSDKPLNLNDDISSLGSKEVTVERRVLFRMDLPNKKSIGVKAKPNRMIRDVFKPILNKYGYRMDAIDVHLCGHSEPLHLEELVSSIDNQRVVVTIQSADVSAHMGLLSRFLSSTRPPLPNKFPSNSSHGLGANMLQLPSNKQTLDEITNEIFGDLMDWKSNSAHNFDELGILDLGNRGGVQMETGGDQPCLDLSVAPRNDPVDGGRDPGKQRTKGKVTFALQKNTVRNTPQDEDKETLCERLKRAQNLSFDDQRGLAPQDYDLPEFLRGTNTDDEVFQGRESAPGALNRGRDQPQMIRPSSDPVISSRDIYVENQHEHFVEYSRDFASNRHSDPFRNTSVTHRNMKRGSRHKKYRGTLVNDDQFQSSNQSFSQDGILPSEAEADKLFQTSVQESPDFNDPFLTDKSLKDIGFNYHYNKYLARSRNFINCRPRNINFSEFVSGEQLSSPDVMSPNDTIRGEAYEIADNLESTLIQSPHLSPYNSDSSSSIGKENLDKCKSRSSRHTQIHSPITAMDDDVLSEVDTDGCVLHSTPKSGINTRNAGMTPKILGAVQTTQNSNANRTTSDAIMYV